MPLDWKVDRATRLIVTMATGTLAREDFDDYFAAEEARDAAGYGVIFDVRAADLSLRALDLIAFSQVVKVRRSDTAPENRIAIIVGSDAERDMGAYFAGRTAGERPCRLFLTMEDARAWLDEPLPLN